MPSKEIKELRQSGQLEEALIMAQNELDAAPDNIWGKRNISWVYYEYIKKHAHEFDYNSFIENLTKLKELDLPENEVMIFDTTAWQIGSAIFTLQKSEPVDYSKINQVFDIIKEFHFTKPAEGFSLLYKAFHKGYKNWSRYLEFADWWNFDNFRPEDYQKEEYNGRQIMALVEQAYIAYSKKLLEGEESEENQFERIINNEKINEFLPKLEKLVKEHPDYQYPPYFMAKLLLAIGDEESVLSAFLPFAKKKRNDFWVWELMSDVFHDDRKTACLCKALSLNAPEDFVVKTRQKLASILVEKELYAEAKTEIIKILNTRESHEWRIPMQVSEWTQQDWYISAEPNENNRDYYLQHISNAEEILFEDIPEVFVFVEFVNKDKKILNFIKDKSYHGFFSYKGLSIKPKIGDVLRVRLEPKGNEGFYRALTIKIGKEEDQKNIKAIKQVSGSIRVNEGQNFGFLDDVFLAPDFIKSNDLQNQDEITCKAIQSFNKKKNEWGWKCFEILN